jgi:hypothetical protein
MNHPDIGSDSSIHSGSTSNSLTNESLVSSNFKSPGNHRGIIGNYTIDKTIGQGTYGKVKLGRNVLTGEQVIAYLHQTLEINPRLISSFPHRFRLPLRLLKSPQSSQISMSIVFREKYGFSNYSIIRTL